MPSVCRARMMTDDALSYQAWAGMLILIVLVLILNICVRVASRRWVAAH
jgi:hypothetical protein